MVPMIKLSQLCIFISMLLFIARKQFERTKAWADRKPIVNSNSVIFFKKILFNIKH
jgi:hypothetical protein